MSGIFWCQFDINFDYLNWYIFCQSFFIDIINTEIFNINFKDILLVLIWMTRFAQKQLFWNSSAWSSKGIPSTTWAMLAVKNQSWFECSFVTSIQTRYTHSTQYTILLKIAIWNPLAATPRTLRGLELVLILVKLGKFLMLIF